VAEQDLILHLTTLHLIAAHAVNRGLVLVTNNEAEFAVYQALAVENWVGG
jgi:predicted nucleic acid-binding protein